MCPCAAEITYVPRRRRRSSAWAEGQGKRADLLYSVRAFEASARLVLAAAMMPTRTDLASAVQHSMRVSARAGAPRRAAGESRPTVTVSAVVGEGRRRADQRA